MAFKIRASAHYLPKKTISAEELDRKLFLNPGICRDTFGVQYRHVADRKEHALHMGGEAVMLALSEAGMQMKDLDLLVWASATNHQALPYNAAGLLAHLNIDTPIASLDVNTSCLSFLTALELSHYFLLGGKYKNIMIVSSELASVGIKKGNVELSTMFADGAAAYILNSDPTASGMFYSNFRTYSEAYQHCQIRGGGSFIHPSTTDYTLVDKASYFEMEGGKIYKYVARYINEFIENGLKNAAVSRDEIKYVVPHQASASGLKHLQRRLSFSDDQFVNIYSVMGNQVAASLPIALHHVLSTKETKSGDTVLLIGSGAGLSLGMGVLKI